MTLIPRPQTQTAVDSGVMLVGFLNVLSPRFYADGLAPPCIRMVVTMMGELDNETPFCQHPRDFPPRVDDQSVLYLEYKFNFKDITINNWGDPLGGKSSIRSDISIAQFFVVLQI